MSTSSASSACDASELAGGLVVAPALAGIVPATGGAGVGAAATWDGSGWRAGAGLVGVNVCGGANCGVVVANSSWRWRSRIQISQPAMAAHVSQRTRLDSIGSTWH
jgi:hypothetical protein